MARVSASKFEKALRESTQNVRRRYDNYVKITDPFTPGVKPPKTPAEKEGFNYFRSGAIVCFHVLRDEIGPVAKAAGIDLSAEMGDIWPLVRVG